MNTTNPLDVIPQPQSYKDPIIVETKGKLGCHDVIVYQEPDSEDFQKDKDGWDHCYQAIFNKFAAQSNKTAEGKDKITSLAIACPESHRPEDGRGSNKAYNKKLAQEALDSAYAFATENPSVSIIFKAKNDDILEVYREVMVETKKGYKEIYGVRISKQQISGSS